MKLKIKPQYKVLAIVLSALLIVIATVFGTLAWLVSETQTVTNTFTYGKVEITMDESFVDESGVADYANRVSENTYKLVPGRTYVKDPTIHVDENSENCFLFVEIDNQLGSAASFALTPLDADNAAFSVANDVDWIKYSTNDTTTIWYLPMAVKPNCDVEVFSEFTFSSSVGSEDMPLYEGKKITLLAYAIQAEGFANGNGYMTNVDTCWTALNQ